MCVFRWIFLVLLAGWGPFALAGPLTFGAALDLAEQQSPALAASSAQLAAAQSAAVPAGSLPDPKVVAGIDNYPISGPERGQLNADPMTMQRVGFMQDVPNAAKRRAREDVAQARVAVAAAERETLRVKVRREAALAWLSVYYLQRRLALFDSLDRENRLLDDAVRARVASGRGPVSDAVMPRQEAAALADRRDELERDLTRARAGLRRLLGPAADGALAGDPPVIPVDPQRLRAHLHAHPELVAVEAERRRAEGEVREATAQKRVDWGVEMDYQHRASQFGDMVSVQFTFALPVAPGTRQDPIIAAKTQELTRIDAERDAMLRDHADSLESDLADYQALTRQAARSRGVSLPLAQEKVDLTASGYRAGKGELAALVAARAALVEERLRLIDLEGRQAAAAARLYYAQGEARP
ncbi:MAG: TolC family protein [Betaproteobacteria bacterium]|nr:TolC family protein [Betaproteobacteria bacterium]